MMITTTIKQLKDGDCPTGDFRIYVIEGEGCILYVGKSKCAVTRVLSHLGLEWEGFWGSAFDRLLTSNRQANDYTVILYSESDINRLVAGFGDTNSKVDDLESLLIYELSPVFNFQGKKKHKENTDRWYKLHPPIEIDPITLREAL